ncbi:MAG: CDP-glucose 4,6-dehydratase [Gammaproteobacteria bacterium]
MDKAFWQGRRVLLTGHTGFKGGWIALWLQQMGAQVTGFALPAPTEPSLFNEADIAAGMSSVIGDIRDYTMIHDCVSACMPEVVFHMAAQPLVRLSYEIPVETYATNVMGTVHLLEAIRHTDGVRAIVNITSDKCYENHEHLQGYREEDPLGGHDPYSNSKGCMELVTLSYRRSFLSQGDCALASVRAGNVIGGGDWAPDRLIPDILRSFEKGLSVEIRNPHAIRPWQHVLEPLSGYLELAERLYHHGQSYAEAWNFGPDTADERPVQTVVEQLVDRWGGDVDWRHDDSLQPHEASYLKLNCNKARQRLDWHPVWHLEQALQRIIYWHKAWLNGENMRDHTLEEISDYMRDRVA